MSNDALKTAMAWIIKTEGGYVNDPNDAGGETNFGISKRQYPELDIRALTVDDALEIYRTDYWRAYHCDEMPDAIALWTFDGLVQHRPKTASRILQRAIGANADGIIGPKTLTLAKHTNPHLAARMMALERLDLYDQIVRSDSSKARFINGWRARVVDLYEFALLEYFS